MTPIEPIYHLKDAAERCGVPVDVVREWIGRGLRHVPLAKTRRSRGILLCDALIRESWIMAYLDSQARVRRPEKATIEPSKPAGKPARRGRKVADRGSPLGPCPV